jgi:hypothetical protein
MLFRKKTIKTFRECFEQFCREHPDQCSTKAGLSESDVARMTKDLRMHLPTELAEMLRRTNGADLFRGSMVLYGQQHGQPPYDVADIVKETAVLRDRGLISDRRIVFGQRETGQVFVLEACDQPRVWRSNFEADLPSREFKSLSEWWENELRHWSEVLEMEEIESGETEPN